MAGIELATAYVTIAASTKGLGKDIARGLAPVEKHAATTGKNAGKKFSSGVMGSVKGLGGAMAGALGAAVVVAGFKDIIGKASELEQSVGGVQAVFKDNAGVIEKASKEAAQNLGLSRDEYNKLATTLGAGLKNKGIKDYTKSTQDLITIGGDLAAQFGGSTQEAVDALSSAMRGESDPIEKYGVALNETAVNAKLAGMGVKKSNGAYTEQQKTMARLALITDQTKDAQGAFGREADTAAGRQARLRASLDNVKTTIGQQLLPVVSNITGKLSEFVTGMDNGTGAGGKFKKIIVQVKDGVAAAVKWFVKYQDILVPLAAGVGAIVAAMKVWSVITKTYIAIQTALNIVLAANPIGLVVLAIIGLIAIVVLAYKKNETFRRIVDAVWKGIKTAIKAVVDWFVKTAWPWLRDTFDRIKAGFTIVKDTLGRAWKAIKDAAQTAIRTVVMKFLGMVETIIKGAAKAFGWVPGLGGKLKSAATEFGKFKDRVNKALGGVNDKTVNVGIKFKAGTKLAYDARHQGIANGGLVKRAAGGVIPGPYRGPKADNVLGISDFGVPTAWVNPDEFITNVAATRKMQRNHPGVLEHINATGTLPGYASGGFTVRTGLPSRRVVDDSVATEVLNTVGRSAKMLQDAMGVGIGSKAFGWRQLWSIVHSLIPGIRLTSAYRPGAITALGNKSLHGMGRAIDLAPPSMAAFNTIKGAFPNATQLFYGPADGRTLLRGKPWRMDPVTKRNHYDHIHLAMANGGLVPKPLLFDRGGVLPTGTSLVHNATGAPEPLARVGMKGNTTVQLMVGSKQLAEVVIDEMGNVLSGGRTSVGLS